MVEHLMEGEMQIEGIVRSDKTNTAISDLNFKKRKHNGKVKYSTKDKKKNQELERKKEEELDKIKYEEKKNKKETTDCEGNGHKL